MEGSVNRNADGRCPTEAQAELQAGRSWMIGDMARDFRVSLRTLRFYEDRGLLRPCRSGTSRLYSGRDRLHLQMILKGKQLGFTLAEIREILARDDSAGELKLEPEQILAQIRHLEHQLGTLEAALAELRRAQGRTPGNGHMTAA
jgi:DNA-binding transcriptional MerR regulator